MKNIKIIFLALIVSLSSYAQDPQLFDNDWYLQKVIIEDIDYFPPINPEVGNVDLLIVENYISALVCESIASDIATITNEFFIIDEFFWLPDGTCDLEETVSFQGVYFHLFFNWQEQNNSFNYNIETGAEDFKVLTLTNSNGDVAIYGNELLANQVFDNSSFTIYPNPVKNILQISTQSQGYVSVIINKVTVYDVLGKLVLEESNPTPTMQLDVSSLASGLLLVQIETNKGTVVKKVLKE